MDEQTKAQIRREFRNLFMRVAIGIPVLSAILLAWWLLEDRHGHFLWLTVLPLVFLVPLYRYHLALRGLTEPAGETERVTTELRTINSPRDEAAFARIRSQAKIQQLAVVIFLVLISVLWFKGVSDVADITTSSERRLNLIEKSLLVGNEFKRFSVDRGQEIAACVPPSGKLGLDEWAKQVQGHFGYPVPVFVIENSRVRWLIEPADSLIKAETQEDFDTLAHSRQRPMNDYGTVRVYALPKGIRVAEHKYMAWLAKRTDESAAWGAVTSLDEEWLAFFRALSVSAGDRLTISGPACALNGIFALPTSQLPEYRIGLRATRKDSVIFASPGLKVTADSLCTVADKEASVEVAYFAPQKDYGSFLRREIWSILRWGAAFFSLMMLIPTFRWYRVVRRLTEPVEGKG